MKPRNALHAAPTTEPSASTTRAWQFQFCQQRHLGVIKLPLNLSCHRQFTSQPKLPRDAAEGIYPYSGWEHEQVVPFYLFGSLHKSWWGRDWGGLPEGASIESATIYRSNAPPFSFNYHTSIAVVYQRAWCATQQCNLTQVNMQQGQMIQQLCRKWTSCCGVRLTWSADVMYRSTGWASALLWGTRDINRAWAVGTQCHVGFLWISQ